MQTINGSFTSLFLKYVCVWGGGGGGGGNQVRDMTAFSIHFFIVHHIKITIHLPYCDPKLVYDNNTKINYTVED